MKYFSQMKWCFHVFLSRGYLWYFFLFIFLPIDLLYYLIIPPLGNFFGQRHNIHKCPLFKKAGMLPRNPHHALSFFSPPCKFPRFPRFYWEAERGERGEGESLESWNIIRRVVGWGIRWYGRPWASERMKNGFWNTTFEKISEDPA